MVTNKLELSFKNEVGDKFNLAVDNPNPYIEKDDLKDSMEAIINENIFQVKEKDLVAIEAARLITRKVEELL